METVLKAGNPLLKKVAAPVTNFGSSELKNLIDLLFENLHDYHGAGICAPQLGISKAILVYGFERNLRYPEQKPIPLTVLINPEILAFSSETNQFLEGCLSVPNLRGLVPRANTISFRAYTFEGEIFEKEAQGFEARIIQHEIDHLHGKLFPERMTDLRSLQYTSN